MNALKKESSFTFSDIENLPEGVRAELIDGDIFYMVSPSRIHQEIISQTLTLINNHIAARKGKCKAYPAPFAVWPFGMEDDTNYLEPDITVVCHPDRLTDKGCNGAPDFIIEVVSPSTAGQDYLYKLNRYKDAGIREYWIVNPDSKVVNTFLFEAGTAGACQFTDTISCFTLEGLTVCFADLLN